jgi:hypothetical protein
VAIRGDNVPHISLEGINMAIFVQVQDLSGRLVWVNPAQINYMHVVGEKTVLYFDKERSIDLREPIEELLALFDPSRS